MAEQPSDWSPPEKLTPEWMAQVDEDYLSPQERSQKIMSLLEEETMYDTICFCIEYLGRVAVPGFFAENEETRKHVAALGATLYGLHYFQAPNILGPPDRTPELKAGMFKEFISNMKPDAREALFDAVREYIPEEERSPLAKELVTDESSEEDHQGEDDREDIPQETESVVSISRPRPEVE